MSTYPCVSSLLQNKNTPYFPERFYAKPRLVAGIEFPLLSTEIICQSGFKPWIYSNFPSQPIHAFLHSLLIISHSSILCQLFERTFFNFFRKFFRTLFIAHFGEIYTPTALLFIYIIIYWRAHARVIKKTDALPAFFFYRIISLIFPSYPRRNARQLRALPLARF